MKVYVILYDEAGHERGRYSMVKVFDNMEEASKCMDAIAKDGGVFTYRVETVYSEYGGEEE